MFKNEIGPTSADYKPTDATKKDLKHNDTSSLVNAFIQNSSEEDIKKAEEQARLEEEAQKIEPTVTAETEEIPKPKNEKPEVSGSQLAFEIIAFIYFFVGVAYYYLMKKGVDFGEGLGTLILYPYILSYMYVLVIYPIVDCLIYKCKSIFMRIVDCIVGLVFSAFLYSGFLINEVTKMTVIVTGIVYSIIPFIIRIINKEDPNINDVMRGITRFFMALFVLCIILLLQSCSMPPNFG